MLLFIASACPLTISAMGKLFKVVGSRALKIQQKFHVLFVDRIVVGEIPVFWLICLTETSFSSSKSAVYARYSSLKAQQCEALNESLREIDSPINCCHFSSDDEREEAIYIMQSSKLAIRSWQCHILRSFNQDQARLDFLDILDNVTVLIVNDWAMKFLPQRYRESQSDWFGKRGISWHISVVYRRSDSQLQWQGYVHIIQSCSQDSTSVISVIQDVVRSVKS